MCRTRRLKRICGICRARRIKRACRIYRTRRIKRTGRICRMHRTKRACRIGRIRRIKRTGRIGRIRMIRVFGPNAGWDIPATSWNSDRAQVSPYTDWGAHACDIVRWLTRREASRVYAQFASYTDIPPADQSSMALYTLDDGTLVTIWLTYELPPPTLGSAMQILITGSEGVIELDAYGTVRIGTPDGGWETTFEQPPFDPLDADDSLRLQAYASQLDDLIAAIRAGRDPQVSGRQGAATTSWLEAAEHSAASGESVAIDVQRAVDAA